MALRGPRTNPSIAPPTVVSATMAGNSLTSRGERRQDVLRGMGGDPKPRLPPTPDYRPPPDHPPRPPPTYWGRFRRLHRPPPCHVPQVRFHGPGKGMPPGPISHEIQVVAVHRPAYRSQTGDPGGADRPRRQARVQIGVV